MANFFTKLLSLGSDRQLKDFKSQVNVVNYLEDEMKALSDEQLRAKTDEFRQRFENGETLDELLPEAFAVVREASVRTTGMRHFDVQLIGGMVLHKGQIAEMRTGEGKTLVSTLAVYLNALPGQGVHVVTVNDYLAKRDSEWMGRIYKFLGLTVGLLQNSTPAPLRKAAYDADVTYGTNTEFGFDYLRDNMVTSADKRVQRGHNYCIIDEVDSILIDEARTPLIISGQASKANDLYISFAKAVRKLKVDEDFDMDEAKRTISANEQGLAKVESFLHIEDLYADLSGQLSNHLQQALKAQFLFKKGVDYIVVDGEVKIVDEFTGRIMEGRRYSEGLHQAIEAKEGVLIRAENQTMATITLQNYFRLYNKLSGMTGTAKTEDAEFRDIYKLEVQIVPPNRPVMREDLPDLVYRTVDAKFNAVVEDVLERHARQQPCLVGTVSIENSEKLSALFKKRGIPHEVLNAKQHEREAKIVAQAGRAGAVTIATNMAGRGTDILLGGNPDFLAEDLLLEKGVNPEEATELQRADALEQAKAICAQEAEVVRAAGGLAVIGTERHESRRIDNQLRGRAGRQGDPGETRFYISLEDDLMRLFGGDRINNMMEKFDLDEDTPIENKMLTKAIENAQTTMESRNFQSRKSVLEYDDVMNKQREIIYAQRRQVLDGMDIKDTVLNMMHTSISNHVSLAFGENQHLDEAGYREMLRGLEGMYFAKGAVQVPASEIAGKSEQDFTDLFIEAAEKTYAAKETGITAPIMRELERVIMLRVVDEYWMDHIDAMDDLKQGIRLQAYGNNDPVDVYKRESLSMFEEMVSAIQDETVRRLYSVRLKKDEEVKRERVAKGMVENVGGDGTAPKKQPVKKAVKIGRNDPCPCGSGLKWKKCTCPEYHKD